MAPTMSMLGRLQSTRARAHEQAYSQGDNAPIKLATRLTQPLRVNLSESGKRTAGTAVHWAYGTLWGAGFAAAKRWRPGLPPFSGAAFGAALWLLGDELAVPALGLAPKPGKLPASAHGKALGAHLAYGLGVEAGLRLLQLALSARRR